MQTSASQKLYGLDHLRAFAILFVFMFHYGILSNGQPDWLASIASFGWTGVDLFFVLSGFLIASQLFGQIKTGQSISFRIFFIKRAFRILPAFWVITNLYFVIPFFREKEALPPLWKFLTFTQNLGLNLKDYGTFSHAWSLCVEEHFYLLLPVILMILQKVHQVKKGFYLIIALLVMGFVIRIYSYNHCYLPKINDENSWVYWYKYIYYPTYNRLDGLLAGVSIAAIYQFFPSFWARINKYGNVLLLLGLILLSAAYILCKEPQSYDASVFGFPLVALGYGCIVAAAVSSNCILYKFKSGFTSFIATLSYGIYLSHKGVIHITHQLLGKYNLNENLMLLICLITCTVLAFILHIVIEKPFMNWRHKIIKHT